MTYKLANGWLTEVFGHPVRKVDCTYLDHTRYWSGCPRGVMWHYTAGCGTDLSGISAGRGYNICSLSIDRDGVIREYLPLEYSGWHAYDATYQYIGVEHSGLPGNCNLTDAEYDASTKLFAALVEWIRDEYGRVVDVRHAGGCSLNENAFKQHADGVGCSWNPNTHTDGLEPAGWSWGQYLDDVGALLAEGGEDVTDEQADQIAGLWQLVRGINGSGAPAEGASDRVKSGYAAGQKVLGVWQWQKGFTDATKGAPKPADPEAAMGWQAAKGAAG